MPSGRTWTVVEISGFRQTKISRVSPGPIRYICSSIVPVRSDAITSLAGNVPPAQPLNTNAAINHAWIKSFCQLYADSVAVPFSIHARSETVSETLVGHLAAAGCRHIVFGVESGSERVRREILQRNVSNDRLRESFHLTQAAGVLATANYMLGIPGETKADIEQTLALHDELKPDDFGYFVFYPYPGTSLFKLCTQRGYLPDKPFEFPAHHHATVLTLPDLSAGDIEEYYHRFTELRIRDRLADLPADANEETRQALIEQIEQDAARG